MDENEVLYHEKNSYFKCFVVYLIVSLIVLSLILSIASGIIPKEYSEEKRERILLYTNIIASFTCSIASTSLIIYFLKSVLKKDALKIKNDLKIIIPLVLVSYGAVFLGEYLCTLFYSLFDMGLTSNNQETLKKMLETNLVPLMIIIICITGPFVEEIIFRKCIFGFFKKDIYPLVISSLTFGLLHVFSSGDYIHILPYIVTGFIFGGIYALSKRNIYASYLAHVIANTISVIIILV